MSSRSFAKVWNCRTPSCVLGWIYHLEFAALLLCDDGVGVRRRGRSPGRAHDHVGAMDVKAGVFAAFQLLVSLILTQSPGCREGSMAESIGPARRE